SASRSAIMPAPPRSLPRCLSWHCYSRPYVVRYRPATPGTPPRTRRARGKGTGPIHARVMTAPRRKPAPDRRHVAGSGGVFHAALHIHSRFSRACNKDSEIPPLAWWAARKGVTVVGPGDFPHPAWAVQLAESLVPAEPGLFRLRPELASRLSRT